ncbi:30 kDa heat shock protein [Penicillium atrosanguineum]|uniref:30 kDa heat shock protein n=1 Tax=Penicillium atrosanguineum TaxID=1132637 RepID=UPI0023A67E16|nr:30 kDa heat shock protein [Penicillium atrosanguineum]KAJ5298668.1 30 kDa heat shock protein [Penicillium atrosanguineum]
MRSFFKKPAWAANAGDTGAEFYRRSGQTYGDIVAANREAHEKAKTESEKHGNIEENLHGTGGRHSKRPRLANESENTAADAADTIQYTPESGPEEPHQPLNLPGNCRTQRGDYFETEDETLNTTSTHCRHGRSEDDLSTLPTPLPDKAVSPKPPTHLPSQNMDFECNDTAHKDTPRLFNAAATPRPAQPSTPPREDPIVQILITSQMPNTKPLLVHRKMSQGLRDVRIEWCKRQEITKEMQPSVHLTWRGRRLFDVTTCRSLGIKMESKLTLSELDDDPIAGPRELRIHMEAVTDDPLLLNRPGLSPDEDEASHAPPNPEDGLTEPMKLTLRSSGLSDVRIRARPKTLVSKLISVYRNRQNIPADRDVSLLFDGDRMDPDTRLRDHDIADLDMVDVQVKLRV